MATNVGVRAVSYQDPGSFLAEAGPHLMKDVPRHQLILGIAETLREQPDVYTEYHAWAVFSGGDLMAAASCTPPHNYVLADARGPDSLGSLVGAIMASAVEAPGAIGNTPTIDEFIELWSARAGVSFIEEMAQGVFTLEQVNRVSVGEGVIRPATSEDRDLIVGWWLAFLAEATPDEVISRNRAEERIDQRLDPTRPQGVSVWEAGGEVVSMSAYSPPVANSVRIGPVYTPPQMRGRGYATSLVARQSQRFLVEGRDRCLLYTDLANPTSNRIYKRIGYRQVAESMVYRFEGT